MAGWCVAGVLYVLAAFWVPIALGVANGRLFGYPGEPFWRRYLIPSVLTALWPIGLIVAIAEIYSNSRRPGGRK